MSNYFLARFFDGTEVRICERDIFCFVCVSYYYTRTYLHSFLYFLFLS